MGALKKAATPPCRHFRPLLTNPPSPLCVASKVAYDDDDDSDDGNDDDDDDDDHSYNGNDSYNGTDNDDDDVLLGKKF